MWIFVDPQFAIFWPGPPAVGPLVPPPPLGWGDPSPQKKYLVGGWPVCPVNDRYLRPLIALFILFHAFTHSLILNVLQKFLLRSRAVKEIQCDEFSEIFLSQNFFYQVHIVARCLLLFSAMQCILICFVIFRDESFKKADVKQLLWILLVDGL